MKLLDCRAGPVDVCASASDNLRRLSNDLRFLSPLLAFARAALCSLCLFVTSLFSNSAARSHRALAASSLASSCAASVRGAWSLLIMSLCRFCRSSYVDTRDEDGRTGTGYAIVEEVRGSILGCVLSYPRFRLGGDELCIMLSRCFLASIASMMAGDTATRSAPMGGVTPDGGWSSCRSRTYVSHSEGSISGTLLGRSREDPVATSLSSSIECTRLRPSLEVGART